MSSHKYYEFFAGGGIARAWPGQGRAGLGEGWRCVLANDIDPKKRDSYVANWGATIFSERHQRLAD